mmetsp:Transcript_7062/g.26750  ORF Transcript_7062/g.26750 Transcript_7062/m.26750 type:complete len:221 (+) Transcript_7062:2928-3590(+)
MLSRYEPSRASSSSPVRRSRSLEVSSETSSRRSGTYSAYLVKYSRNSAVAPCNTFCRFSRAPSTSGSPALTLAQSGQNVQCRCFITAGSKVLTPVVIPAPKSKRDKIESTKRFKSTVYKNDGGTLPCLPYLSTTGAPPWSIVISKRNKGGRFWFEIRLSCPPGRVTPCPFDFSEPSTHSTVTLFVEAIVIPSARIASVMNTENSATEVSVSDRSASSICV